MAIKSGKTPYIFRQLAGLTIAEFEKIVKKVRSEWEKVEKMPWKKISLSR